MPVFKPSHRRAPNANRVADLDPGETVELTVVLKPGAPLDPLRHAAGNGLSHAEYHRRHATTEDTIGRVRDAARHTGLLVIDENASAHTVRLRGTYAQAIVLLHPEQIGVYETAGGQRFVARSGYLSLPQDLLDDVVAVMGLDQRPIAKPHFRLAKTAATSYQPTAVAQAYQYPTGVTGAGQTIGIIELGGGYDDTQIAEYFTSAGVNRTGTVTSVSVDNASNAPDGDPSGADGEVQLDIEVAGSIAPGANIVLYFGPNQGSGFADAISAAVNDQTNKPSVLSISWGGPESSYAQQDLDAMNQSFAQAATLGITVFAASGDSGATDGTDTNTVDFPASSPNVTGCGGTSLPPGGPETAWNDGTQGGASGGGYSAAFALPSWQQGVAGISGTQRGVPDVSGDADPETGYAVSIDGTATVIGGTSAVAPLYAGLLALINQSAGKNAGFVNPVLYANEAAFTDITSGNNNGYDAGPEWDPVTGLGSPIGTKILAALSITPST